MFLFLAAGGKQLFERKARVLREPAYKRNRINRALARFVADSIGGFMQIFEVSKISIC